ncbi:MAG: trehalose-phosphatase [Ectothiorhodospiraceae bacterium]|nr:trehalose-phosphatase [Ectothiorhodospiraceae bacterium]
MQKLSTETDIESWMRRLDESGRRIIMLDYDGTLAPFTPNRDKAFPYPGLREILERLQANPKNRLIIVSGRAIADLQKLLQLDPSPEIWGSHGLEHRTPDGEYELTNIDSDTLERIDRAASTISGKVPVDALERKPSSVAVHWRGRTDEEAERLRSLAAGLWAEHSSAPNLELHEFDGGIELRISSITKADAVNAILAENEGIPAVYLGDDKTDEDAFNALGDKGLRILVRKEHRATAADLWITPPDELFTLLKRWI